MKEKLLFTGNDACGEGAVRAGCAFYAGYPITPQNELTAYMSVRMEEEGRTFIQAESELAAQKVPAGEHERRQRSRGGQQHCWRHCYA